MTRQTNASWPADSDPRPPQVLLAEDHHVVAVALKELLRANDIQIVGPAGTVPDAMDLLEESIDAAILDIDLRGQVVTPVADALLDRGIPFIFLTGYAGLRMLPPHLRSFICLHKPCNSDELLGAVEQMLQTRSAREVG